MDQVADVIRTSHGQAPGRNGWLAERLSMGTESAVARHTSEIFRGERPQVKPFYYTLIAKVLVTLFPQPLPMFRGGYLLTEFPDKVLLRLTGTREEQRKTIDAQRFGIDPFTVKFTTKTTPVINRFLLSQ